MKRVVALLLTVVLILGVGAAIFFSAREQINLRSRVTIRGLIGSEKEPFFHDPRVIDALAKHGLVVEVEKAGSRQIANRDDLPDYDFGFPAGIPAAELMRQKHEGTHSYDAFFTPMAIASWEPIAQILTANGIATDHGGYYTLDMESFLTLMAQEKRWSDLASNAEYDVDKAILVTSTDIRKSNSAAMYLALASYVANDNRIVQRDDMARVLPLMTSLFLRQGYLESSSATPFENYLIMGMGKSPLVMVYEAQFIYQAATADGGLRPGMALIYPEPTIFTKHILVAFSEGGQRLGELLETDPELQRLVIEHGFRNQDIAYFQEFTGNSQLTLPDSLTNVIEPPTYEVIEGMIQEIEVQFD